MRRGAWVTFNRNQNKLARLAARARGAKTVNCGLTFKEVQSAAHVFYCPACSAPVVDSPEGRARHARKSVECNSAMKGLPMVK